MRKILYPLFLFFLSSPALHSQGICDSVVTIHPIQSACAGTEERYLSASHAGGVFSGPGVVYDNGYLNTENLTAGFYTVKYTITGPGGCTVTATRDYEVRDAEYINTWATGVIDCSDANSKVFLHAILQNPNNYFAPQWEGPTFSNYHAEGADVQTASAGLHKFYAYSATPGQCMAYGFQMVNFTHAPAEPALESCTDCSDWPLKVKSTPTIPGWKTRLIKPDGTNFGNIENCTAVWFQAPPGNYKVEMYNDQMAAGRKKPSISIRKISGRD